MRVVHAEREVEEFVHWDNTMALTFFKTDDYIHQISPSSMLIGETVNFQVSWIENFIPKFPVVFFASTCTVESMDGAKSFDIVKNGCLSNLVTTSFVSDKFTSQELQISYQSFAFTQVPGSYDVSLFCTLEFCLKNENNENICDGEPEVCPVGYF